LLIGAHGETGYNPDKVSLLKQITVNLQQAHEL